MDKLFNSPLFVKIISFFIAIMLFFIVNFDNPSNQPGTLPTFTSGTNTIEKVPLNVYYNEEKHAIMEIQENVEINLRGPQNFLAIFQIARPTYEVYVDLRGLEAGTHNIPVQHRNFPFPNEISVSVVPAMVRVVIEEKRTISIPVEIDLVNKAEISDGYTVGAPIVYPVNVEVTAAESMIETVAFAKGYVDIRGVNESIEKKVPIKVYDQQGNELHIDVNPSVVDVEIPVISPSKLVPLRINHIGEIQEGLSVRSVYIEPRDVTIYGPLEVINQIGVINGIDIDLSKITETTIIEMEIPLPDGVEKVSPEVINVIVEVDIEERVEFEEIPIEVIGLTERMDVAFSSPQTGSINLVAKGAPTSIEQLKRENISVYIDVSQLTVGEHVLPIQVKGPQNITFEASLYDISLIITEVLSTEEEIESEETT